MELKTTKVYVPTDVKNLTKEEIANNPIILFDEGSVNRYWEPMPHEVATHFLKEQSLYTFTKEELEEFKKQIAGDAFEDGQKSIKAKLRFEQHGDMDVYAEKVITQTKQDYISQILKQ